MAGQNHVLQKRETMMKAHFQQLLILLAVVLTGFSMSGCSAPDTRYPSVRGERKCINSGNKLYAAKDYEGALAEYSKALQANPNSPEALFNASCARMRMAEGLASSDKGMSDSLTNMAEQGFMMVAAMRDRASGLASSALYNLGNKEFRADEYQKAIGLYIQALRINPDFNAARRNLRIAQLKQQENQDQNQDQDQNKDQEQDKDKDKDKDQNKDQNQDKNQDQNKDQNKDKDQSQPQQHERLPQQAADRILEANQRQEEATRARLQMRNKERREAGQPVYRKKW